MDSCANSAGAKSGKTTVILFMYLPRIVRTRYVSPSGDALVSGYSVEMEKKAFADYCAA
jgi:hypothetical protein